MIDIKKLFLLLPAALLLSACSLFPSAATTSTSTPIADSTIVIQDMAFSPSSLTVSPGATVSVTNKDLTGHTVTTDDKSFDSGFISNGQTITFVAPTTPGSYRFHCSVHTTTMTGTLIVK